MGIKLHNCKGITKGGEDPPHNSVECGILGFTMLGPEAGEVMAVVQTAMLAELPYTGLRDAILTHPTMAEGLGALFANVPPTPSRADA